MTTPQPTSNTSLTSTTFVKKIELIKGIYTDKNEKKASSEKMEIFTAKFLKDRNGQNASEMCIFIKGYPLKKNPDGTLQIKIGKNPITGKDQEYPQFDYDNKENHLTKKLGDDDLLKLKMYLEYCLGYLNRVPSFVKVNPYNGKDYYLFEVVGEKATVKFNFDSSLNKIYLSLSEMGTLKREYKNELTSEYSILLLQIINEFLTKHVIGDYMTH